MVLALVLPFVVVPLVWLCRDRALMGELAITGRLLAVAATVAGVLVVLQVVGLALLLA